MKQVTHTVDEHCAALFPAEGHFQTVRPQAHIEALLIRMARYSAPAFGKTQGITVLATG